MAEETQITESGVVIPQEVVEFLGKKFFTELISKAREEMGGEGRANVFTQMAADDDVMPSKGY